MKHRYFPGCSLTTNAAAYHRSTMAIAPALGLEFDEIRDWNCCGASETVSLNLGVARALSARNLALAQGAESDDLVCPCSACYVNLTKTDHALTASPHLAEQINSALAEGNLSYRPGSVHVRHLVELLAQDVGCVGLTAATTHPLKGLQVACYYGCLLGRPGGRGPIDDPENPTVLDRMMQALGARVVEFPLKAHCCGGHLTQLSRETSYAMIHRVIKNAVDHGADLIVTACPMCQLNLDAFQGAVNRHLKTDYRMPIVYFTQLIGLALGLDARSLGLGTELVSAAPALAHIGRELAAKEEVKPPVRRRDSRWLPMPAPLPQPAPYREVPHE